MNGGTWIGGFTGDGAGKWLTGAGVGDGAGFGTGVEIGFGGRIGAET